jgi:hypothetical protein
MNVLLQAAKGNRHGHRDYTMLLVCYRHGLRAQELCELEWSQIDLDRATMHVRRVKQGKPATHPIRGDVLRALRQLRREQVPVSNFAFTSERGAPMKPVSFNMTVKRLGDGSNLLGLPIQCSHVAALLRIRSDQHGPRRPGGARLSRPSLDRLDGEIRRAEPGQVQGCMALTLTFRGHDRAGDP